VRNNARARGATDSAVVRKNAPGARHWPPPRRLITESARDTDNIAKRRRLSAAVFVIISVRLCSLTVLQVIGRPLSFCPLSCGRFWKILTARPVAKNFLPAARRTRYTPGRPSSLDTTALAGVSLSSHSRSASKENDATQFPWVPPIRADNVRTDTNVHAYCLSLSNRTRYVRLDDAVQFP